MYTDQLYYGNNNITYPARSQWLIFGFQDNVPFISTKAVYILSKNVIIYCYEKDQHNIE